MRPQSSGIMLLFALCLSCHQSNRNNSPISAAIPALIAEKAIGTYSGSFNKGMITLVINYISGSTVSGYDTHKGLRRNINGKGALKDGHLDFVLKEPGDHPFDGTFYFSLDTASLKISGKWVAKDSAKIPVKKLALSRKKGELMESDSWTVAGGGDTTLLFKEDNTCEYAFYERTNDSTSQLLTIRGNFDVKADTFKIEWQKNAYTPAQTMKLIKVHEKMKDTDGEEYDMIYLRGQGWNFVINEGD